MDAAVAEPSNPAGGYAGRSIEERVSLLEGTITNQDRIFDMLREGQQNLMVGRWTHASTRPTNGSLRWNLELMIASTRPTNGSLRWNLELMSIAGMGAQLNTKIDSNLKWMIGIQIAMWVTIIVAVLL